MEENLKQLLLKDLSARLPYRVYISPVDCGKAILIGIKDGNPLLWDTIHKKEYDKPWDIEYIKPYLRPLSSMTEEEKKELLNRLPKYWNLEIDKLGDLYFDIRDVSYPDIELLTDIIDWLNKKMFAYRTINGKDMFELGLAVEAPADMYNNK